MRCWSLWAILCGSVLRDVRCLMYWIRIFQPERSFRISQTDPQRFNQVLNIFRNIIKVDIAPNQYTQTKMKFTRDVYAQPQVVLTIQSPNEKDFAAFVQKNAQSIIGENGNE